MPSIKIDQAGAAFTVDGDTSGWFSVADNGPFYPGATVWLSSSTVDSQECIISAVSGANQIQVRFVVDYPHYGVNDISTFLVADGARVDQPLQACPVIFPDVKFDRYPP